MTEFFRKLDKYIRKVNMKNINEDFVFSDDVKLPQEIAEDIYNVLQARNTFQELWEKECDYNRLLRLENSQLQEELEYICSECVDTDTSDELCFHNSNVEEELVS